MTIEQQRFPQGADLPSAMLPTLLPLAFSQGHVRELRSWGETDRDALVKGIREVSLDWHHRWNLDPEGSPSRDEIPGLTQCEDLANIQNSLQGDIANWQAIGPENSGIWYRLQPGVSLTHSPLNPHSVLLMGMFEDPDGKASGRIADDLVQAAWLDWVNRLMDLFRMSPDTEASAQSGGALGIEDAPEALPLALVRPWSGALGVTIPWCGQVLNLAISAERVSACLGRSPSGSSQGDLRPSSNKKVFPIFEALGNLPLALRVDLLDLDLDLGTLASLQVGDILATTHPLDAPMIIGGLRRHPNDSTWCGGYLGRRDTQRAIELVSLPVTASPRLS